MKESTGTLYGILPDGRALIAAALPEDVRDDVRVLWPDREEITAEQRRKIFAIVGEIACWSGYTPEDARKGLTADFLRTNMEQLQSSVISLAIGGGCDKGTASLFLDYLINFCLDNNVPTKQPLRELADDLERYTYAALMHKRCLVCGKKAELHHAEGSMVGMGYNRDTKPQIGALVMPLCREHHGEYHSIGATAFGEKYHAVAVAMDERIARKYGLNEKARRTQK